VLSGLLRLGRAPETAPPVLVAALALIPPAVAGVIFFRQVALAMLAIGLTVGVAAQIGARLLKQPVADSPVLPALIAVALVGPRAPLVWTGVVAAAAAAVELGRARFTPAARVQAGIIAYALVLLLSFGAPAEYVSPGGTGPAHEPIRLWLQYFGTGDAPIDPVRLYVGNVAGPAFATSMLAVVVGAAWLWYARRLSLLVVLTFLVGALIPIEMQRWAAGYQLLSGPLWFVAALILADRRTLPTSPVGRPLMGLAAGTIALGVRTRGFAIESAPVTVAAMQLLAAGVQGAGWLRGNRQQVRARLGELREAARSHGNLGRQGPRSRSASPPAGLNPPARDQLK
jgi:NQR2, RnfD, RnfE family